MRVWPVLLWIVLSLACVACAAAMSEPATGTGAPTQSPRSEDAGQRAALPNLGPAPDITNGTWLNTDGPLSLAALRGQVVLVEFWTFG